MLVVVIIFDLFRSIIGKLNSLWLDDVISNHSSYVLAEWTRHCTEHAQCHVSQRRVDIDLRTEFQYC